MKSLLLALVVFEKASLVALGRYIQKYIQNHDLTLWLWILFALLLFLVLSAVADSFMKYFHPEIVAEEKRGEVEVEPPKVEVEVTLRKKARRIGWMAFAGSIPISVAAMMINGTEFEAAGAMSLFIAAAVGLLGWSFSGLYLRATRHS